MPEQKITTLVVPYIKIRHRTSIGAPRSGQNQLAEPSVLAPQPDLQPATLLDPTLTSLSIARAPPRYWQQSNLTSLRTTTLAAHHTSSTPLSRIRLSSLRYPYTFTITSLGHLILLTHQSSTRLAGITSGRNHTLIN